MSGAVAKGCARHVHGGVAHADDGNRIAQLVALGIGEIVETVMDVAEALALHIQRAGLLGAGTDEDGLIPVAEEIVDHQHRADGSIGADGNAQLFHAGLIAVKKALGQAVFGNAVLEHTADLALPLEDGDGIALLGKLDGDGHAGGAAADDGDLFLFFHLRLIHDHTVEIHVGDIGFNAGKMHRSVLSAADAVSGTLFFMVADNGTDSGERVILEEHLPGLHKSVLLKELDHNGD